MSVVIWFFYYRYGTGLIILKFNFFRLVFRLAGIRMCFFWLFFDNGIEEEKYVAGGFVDFKGFGSLFYLVNFISISVWGLNVGVFRVL